MFYQEMCYGMLIRKVGESKIYALMDSRMNYQSKELSWGTHSLCLILGI